MGNELPRRPHRPSLKFFVRVDKGFLAELSLHLFGRLDCADCAELALHLLGRLAFGELALHLVLLHVLVLAACVLGAVTGAFQGLTRIGLGRGKADGSTFARPQVIDGFGEVLHLAMQMTDEFMSGLQTGVGKFLLRFPLICTLQESVVLLLLSSKLLLLFLALLSELQYMFCKCFSQFFLRQEFAVEVLDLVQGDLLKSACFFGIRETGLLQLTKSFVIILRLLSYTFHFLILMLSVLFIG